MGKRVRKVGRAKKPKAVINAINRNATYLKIDRRVP